MVFYVFQITKIYSKTELMGAIFQLHYFHILEIKITDDNCDHSGNVWNYVTFWVIISGP